MIPMIGEWIDTRDGLGRVVAIRDGKMTVLVGESTASGSQSVPREIELFLPGTPRNRAERRKKERR